MRQFPDALPVIPVRLGSMLLSGVYAFICGVMVLASLGMLTQAIVPFIVGPTLSTLPEPEVFARVFASLSFVALAVLCAQFAKTAWKLFSLD